MSRTTPEQAYRALSHAAEMIGRANFSVGNGVTVVTCKRRKVRRYAPTTTHRRVVQAMAAVMKGTLSPEDAMAILWEWDVIKERGWTP